jgi:ArsR family transcriptional regulator
MSKSLPVVQVQDACCEPLAASPLSATDALVPAKMFKALGEPVRLRLMSMIASHAGGEACVCDLTDTFDLSQPTISHHLKVLKDSGLVTSERRGTWVYYRANPDAFAMISDLLQPSAALV